MAVPNRFDTNKEWSVITKKLHKEYGEKETDWEGTPYVKHIKLGGGLCAQAVAFMANALCIEHTQGAHGVAEITYLAQRFPTPDEPPFGELRIDGLTMAALEEYFRNVGLSGLHQRSSHLDDSEPENETKTETKATPATENQDRLETRNAIVAYVRSGFPVILAVDLGRLKGEISKDAPEPLHFPSIFKTNDRVADRKPDKFKRRFHAVMIVGAHENKNEFLIHDPATFPFLKANTWQLFDAGCYCWDSKAKKFRVKGGQMLAVCPGNVRLPLLGTEHRSARFGLFDFLAPLQLLGFDCLDGMLDPVLQSEFLLCQLNDAEQRARDALKQPLPNISSAVREICSATGVDGKRWCWMQVTAQGVWFWDAELAPPAENDQDGSFELLLAVMNRANGEILYMSPTQRSGTLMIRKDFAFEGTHGRLQRSILTSFSIDGSERALKQAREWFKHAELYTFMQPEVDALLNRTPTLSAELHQREQNFTADVRRHNRARFLRGRDYLDAILEGRFSFWLGRRLPCRPPVASAVDLMSAHSANVESHVEVANSILQNARGSGVSIRGLATFIPEIVSERDSVRDRARDALRFLVRVAALIRQDDLKNQAEHPLSFIEIVAGTRVSSLWQGVRNPDLPVEEGDVPPEHRESDDEGIAHVVIVRNEERGLHLFLQTISEVAEEARKAGIKFLVELEPGPLYILNNHRTLKTLAQMLEPENDFAKLADVLALNLDIAHWQLAGIEPKTIPENVKKLIVNGHISDHGIGHFGDAVLDTIGRIDFKSWLAFLGTTNAKFVSLELEVCEDLDCLAQCDTIMRERYGI